ncbi:NlpC/P60 family protein [Labedaea rhizosphaerae]|uniref:NlpC/P60 family protein n=1 Tax=Labedaea rhizosphaerae TaxID=598644 RepID=UPI001FB5A8CB|nr:NlpC/P60 family protein [Labedaea rhizosphaerae]
MSGGKVVAPVTQAAVDAVTGWKNSVDGIYQRQVEAFAAAAPPGDRNARVQAAIDRAKSQLGVPYAWGGGNANGPTRGITDHGGPADAHGDFKKIGFDCSGLMEYAFAGSGANVHRPAAAEAGQGPHVPLDQIQPGDMVFYAGAGGKGHIHHVAMYIGNGQMIEAPQSGLNVRIVPMRRDNTLVQYATRPIP